MPVNLIVGNDGSNSLQGTAGADLIYGYDPNGPQSQASCNPCDPGRDGSQPAALRRRAARRYRSPVHRRENRADQNPRSHHRTGSGNAVPRRVRPDPDGRRARPARPRLRSRLRQQRLFLRRSDQPGGDAEIRRYHVSANPNVADAASVTPIITIDQTSRQQPQGRLARLRSRRLSLRRDSATAAARRNAAQDVDSLLGKILRLDVHGDAFPGDPRATMPSLPTIPSWGRPEPTRSLRLACAIRGGQLRPRAGRLLHRRCRPGPIGKRSTSARRAPTTVGPRSRVRSLSGRRPLTGGPAVAPIYFYDHTVGQSITGGYVYRGEGEALQGQYFFADFIQGKVFTLRFDGSSWVATERTSQIVPMSAW